MWKTVSKRGAKPGTIWRSATVHIYPPQPITEFRVKELEAVWATEPPHEYTLKIYYIDSFVSIFKQHSVERLENCAEKTRSMEPPFPLAPVDAVSFVCWEEESGPPVCGLMRYVMEVNQLFPLFPIFTWEKYVESVEHHHIC